METIQRPPIEAGRKHAHSQVTALIWGLLFVWIGLALLAQVGWGFGLLGVGAIILAGQAAHQVIGDVRLDVFSTICGLVFLAGGVWELFSIQVGLVPVICIVVGAVLVLSALAARRPA